MKNFKDISKFFTIARANDMQIEFNKNKCGGFQIMPDIGGKDIEVIKEKQMPSMKSSGQVTIGEFKNLVEFLNLDENTPIKLTFYNKCGTIGKEGELSSVSVGIDGTLCLSTIG